MPAPVSPDRPRDTPDRPRRAASRFADALLAAKARGPASPKPFAPSARDAARRRPGDGSARDPSAEVVARAAAEGDRRAAEAQTTAAVVSLRAAVRALPAAVEAARVASGTQLSLSFGPALGVEVRQGAAGLELTLRPGGALDRAAAAELPSLVAALRARGLRVVRAEVRPRADGGPSGGSATGRAR